MAGRFQQQANCHKKTGSGNTPRQARGLQADTLLADRYAPVPLGAAVVLLMVTPFLGSDTGWPILAFGVIAAGVAIPVILHRKNGA